MDFAPLDPELEAEFFGIPGKELDTRNFGPNSWVDFLLLILPAKEAPEKFTLKKFTSQNSALKTQPRNGAKIFTLHFCKAIWLKSWRCDSSWTILRSFTPTPRTPWTGGPGHWRHLLRAFLATVGLKDRTTLLLGWRSYVEMPCDNSMDKQVSDTEVISPMQLKSDKDKDGLSQI